MITEEMQFVAAREGVDAEFVREEVAPMVRLCVVIMCCCLCKTVEVKDLLTLVVLFSMAY